MRKRRIRVLALLLAWVLLFSGCSMEMSPAMQMLMSGYVSTHFDDMEYTTPDVEALLDAVDTCIADAAGDSFIILAGSVTGCMLLYQEFTTNYNLAQIRYSCDMTDIYWTKQYNYCMDHSSEISAAMDQLMYVLADSPHREALEGEDYFGEGYFDDYEGESIWDDTFTALMDREAELLAEYYDLSAQATEGKPEDFAGALCQVLVELVILRQEIADHTGYDSFHAFAYDYYYLRDYLPEQETAYLEQVREVLVPIYRDLYIGGGSDVSVHSRTETETYDYVKSMAENMGGTVLEAFREMTEYGLYDISYGANKYDASFEVYLPMYSEPFVFINPTQTDYDFLTFAHEFGHFCNDYASYGAGASIDVKEIHSQSMEYLSLFYAQTDNDLEKLQMISSLGIYVEQSFYADFEMRLYSMDPETLTADGLFALFEEVSRDYGFDLLGIDSGFLVQIPHFYIAPCYVFSYVVSNDAAMQIYQLEQEESGKGLAKLEEILVPQEITFLAFLESAGLESPFAEGRIQSVAETFRSVLE